MRGAVVGAPEGFALDGVVIAAEAGDPVDFVVVFCLDSAAVRDLAPAATRRVGPDGLVWLCYPKAGALGTDIGRDHGWEPMTGLGYKGVRQIAIDPIWSALRFRRAEFVGC